MDFWKEFSAVKVLGRGQHGSVWLVRDAAARPYALKLFRERPANTMEFQVLSALNERCDWFPRVHGLYRVPAPPIEEEEAAWGAAAAEQENLRYAVLMQQLAGGPADAYVLSRDDVHEVARQVLCQLACMHAAGFLHRDIKPANLVIEDADPLRAYLIDFGEACAVRRPSSTQAQVVLCESAAGDLAYAAPELYPPPPRARPSARSDMWSLGVALLGLLEPELLAHLRFGIGNLQQLKQHRERVAEYAATRLDPADPLDAAVQAMLRAEPSERPTALQALAALE